MDVRDKQDCDGNIRRIQDLLASGIFNFNSAGHVLRQSAFIDLMICLRDLMHKVEKYAKRINFTDDILLNGYVTDVTDAITAFRDACCHIDSFKRLFDDRGNRGAFNVAYGKCKFMKIGDLELTSDYDDDAAVFYGRNRLYFKRHIIRAFNEAQELLAPHLHVPMPIVKIIQANYANPSHAQALVTLLDAYARDPVGGGEPLNDFARANLVRELAARPQAFSVLAFDGAEVENAAPVGLVNCIEGFSTFACRPLVNVHDVVVAASHRGRGIAAQMLAEVERIARGRGACKLTLEVLSGNAGARRLYERVGFADFQLDPAMGQARFLQKWLA